MQAENGVKLGCKAWLIHLYGHCLGASAIWLVTFQIVEAEAEVGGIAGRYGQPEEVAGLIRFLALDPAAAYITGHVLQFNVVMLMT